MNIQIKNKEFEELPTCPKCKDEFVFRVSRGFLFKTILNWLPVKRYYCHTCDRTRYVWNKSR